MNINTRDMAFVKFNEEDMSFVKFNGVTVYESWKNLIANGVPPLTLNKCKGVDLVDYKLYGNSVQEIYSGKNLFDISQGMTFLPSSTAYIENNILYTPYSPGNSRSCYSNQYIEVTPNTTYTYNHDYTGGDRVVIMIYDENKNLIKDSSISIGSNWTFLANYDGYYGSGKNHSVTIPENIKYVRFFYINMNTVGEGNYNSYYNIQFEKGTNATEYEVYVGGVASPNPDYPQEVESVGECTVNLLENVKDIYNGNGADDSAVAGKYIETIEDGRECVRFTSNASTKYTKVKFKEKTQYTISFDCKCVKIDGHTSYPNYDIPLCVYYTSGSQRVITATNDGEWRRITFTTPASLTIDYIGTYNYDYRDYIYIDVNTFQIEESSVATEYEPYGYKIPVKVSNGIEEITTNIYLNEPLRKINDYADYIDFENSKVVRNFKYREFDEDNNWSAYVSIPNHFQIVVNDNYSIQSANYVMSNYYPSHKNTSSYASNLDYAVLSADGNRIRFKNKDVSTLDEWKSWLSGLREKLYVIYRLKTPIEQPIELPNIPTIKGTTILSIDTKIQPSNLEVVYKGK